MSNVKKDWQLGNVRIHILERMIIFILFFHHVNLIHKRLVFMCHERIAIILCIEEMES